MRRLTLLLVAALALAAAACTDRHDDAEAIQRRLQTMPGVSDVRMEYKFDITSGTTFTVGVALDRAADTAQAVAVGRAFVDDEHRHELGGVLSLSYPTDREPGSWATFDFGQYGDPSADDVADSLRVWLRAVHAPGAQAVTLTQPSASVHGRNTSITLTPDVTAADAAALGRIFAEHRPRRTADGADAVLNLSYPAAGNPSATRTGSDAIATFTFAPSDPAPDQVTDNITTWLHAARSPIAQAVSLTQPPREDAGAPVHIVLTPDATEASATELQRSDPGLADVSWTIKVARNDYGDTDDYTSTPKPPNDNDRALWSQIIGIVGPYQKASAVSQPHSETTQAATEIHIEVDRSADTAANVERITAGVPPLLSRFGHPTALDVKTPDGHIEIVVGGCYRHQPDHQRLPLERELSQQYETC